MAKKKGYADYPDNNNNKDYINHHPAEGGPSRNGKFRESLLPLGKCFKSKLQTSGCEICKSKSGHYTTACKGKKGLWKCWDCCGTTQVLLREIPPRDNEKIVAEKLEQKGFQSESSDDDEDGDWEVERILKDRVDEKGGKEFFVKWEGWPMSAATWEPLKHLTGASKLLKEYLSRKQPKSGCDLDGKWEPEYIVRDKFDPERGRLFLVKWVGSPRAKATWEQRKTLATAPRVLGKYLTQLECKAAGLFELVE